MEEFVTRNMRQCGSKLTTKMLFVCKQPPWAHEWLTQNDVCDVGSEWRHGSDVVTTVWQLSLCYPSTVEAETVQKCVSRSLFSWLKQLLIGLNSESLSINTNWRWTTQVSSVSVCFFWKCKLGLFTFLMTDLCVFEQYCSNVTFLIFFLICMPIVALHNASQINSYITNYKDYCWGSNKLQE